MSRGPNRWWILTLSAVALLACSSSKPKAVIVVPSSATSSPDYAGDGKQTRQRYVVRMSDGKRDWEVEFPETASGYEMRIPLKGEGASKASEAQQDIVSEDYELTAADKELLRQLRRENPDIERDGVYKNDKNILGTPDDFEPGAELDEEGRTTSKEGDPRPLGDREDDAAPSRPSYLLGVEEVRRLFRGGNYELALIKVRKLEQAYPNDVQILSMKGSLWYRLGRYSLARDAWEQALQIDPKNKSIIRALKSLQRRGTTSRSTTNGGAPAAPTP